MRAQDILGDGVSEAEFNGTRVRKGTVGAFLANALAFGDPDVANSEREQVLRDLQESAPALRALRLFEVLEIRSPELRAYMEAAMALEPLS